MSINSLQQDLNTVSNPLRAEHSARFFKTGPGEYGQSDVFLGPTVPQCRTIAKKYTALPFSEIGQLLHSKFHEKRLIALFILIHQFQKGDPETKRVIYNYYLKSTKYINNWDLVDSSSSHIVGMYLQGKDWSILKKLARSPDLWEKRISIIATLTFTCAGNPAPALEISSMLLQDPHDLIHKAVGWMLREVGKRCSQKTLTDFLDSHLQSMPRTTLRYAIEKFPESLRKQYLKIPV